MLRCQDAAHAGDSGAREAYLVAAARRRSMQAGVPESLLRPILDLQSRILVLGDPSMAGLPDAAAPDQALAQGPNQAPLPPPERFSAWLLSVYDLLLSNSMAPGYDADLAAELAGDTVAAPAGQPRGGDVTSSKWWWPSTWVDALSTRVDQIAASALLHMRPPHRCVPLHFWYCPARCCSAVLAQAIFNRVLLYAPCVTHDCAPSSMSTSACAATE